MLVRLKPSKAYDFPPSHVILPLAFFPGSNRYRRIREAVDKGSACAPMDMRYIKRSVDKHPEATAECVSFLAGIYNSVAETLPDIRDPAISTSLVDSTSALEMEDSYSKQVMLQAQPEKGVTQKRKGPRRFKKG